MWIVIFGNPNDGFTYAGTFDNPGAANEWADDCVARDYDWWIARLKDIC